MERFVILVKVRKLDKITNFGITIIFKKSRISSLNLNFVLSSVEKLLITSTGAAKEAQEKSLGTFEITGQISNKKPVYKNTKNNDRYLHFAPGKSVGWMISPKDEIGTSRGWILNRAGGEAPHLADKNEWLVTIRPVHSDAIKKKYKKDIIPSTGDGYWTYDPTFKVQVIS